MHPSPDHMQFALVALSVIYVAEKIWVLTAKIITFFDRRAAADKKIRALEDKRAGWVSSKTQVKLPIAAGGHLPENRISSAKRDCTNHRTSSVESTNDEGDVSKKRAA